MRLYARDAGNVGDKIRGRNLDDGEIVFIHAHDGGVFFRNELEIAGRKIFRDANRFGPRSNERKQGTSEDGLTEQ